MNRTFHKLRILAALAFLAPSLKAQEEGRTVAFRVICLEHSQNIREVSVATGSSDGSLTIPLLTGNFTESFKASFPTESAILFVDDPGAPQQRRVVATGKLATGTQQVFLLVPDTGKKIPYRIIAMNDDERSFPMGSVRILNLCAGPIRVNLAGTNMKPINPGKSTTYPPVKLVDEWGMYQARLDFATPDKQWIPVASPSWKGTKLKRDLVIARLNKRSKQPLISYYKDIPPWRKPELVAPE